MTAHTDVYQSNITTLLHHSLIISHHCRVIIVNVVCSKHINVTYVNNTHKRSLTYAIACHVTMEINRCNECNILPSKQIFFQRNTNPAIHIISGINSVEYGPWCKLSAANKLTNVNVCRQALLLLGRGL